MRSEREQVITLRRSGKTYSEIQKELGIKIPKGTLSNWCSKVPLSKSKVERIKKINLENLSRARKKAQCAKKEGKQKLQKTFHIENSNLWNTYDESIETRKIALAVLFIAEGGKRTSSIVFGNSDQNIIKMFLNLLRSVYEVDESRFRVTVQCRVDQDSKKLESYWQKVTNISKQQFYKPQIDKRTKGKPTKKSEYKGVCRIDYFSAKITQELQYIANTLENR